MISLSTTRTDTKTCDPDPKTKLPKTIKRRHSFNSMMKFLSTRDTLFMIPELPSAEDHYSSSFTTGASPGKPRARKTVTKSKASQSTKPTEKKIKKKKSIVHTSLDKALRFVDSQSGHSVEHRTTTKKLHSPMQNSVTTCSTASLTDEESDISSKGYFEKREAKEGRREAATLWEAPLLRRNRRWDERNQYLGDEHFLYSRVRRKRRDSPPVCPVLSED